jgi:hypothetical protein
LSGGRRPISTPPFPSGNTAGTEQSPPCRQNSKRDASFATDIAAIGDKFPNRLAIGPDFGRAGEVQNRLPTARHTGDPVVSVIISCGASDHRPGPLIAGRRQPLPVGRRQCGGSAKAKFGRKSC